MHRSKVCFKCGERRQLSSFYKHPMMADGHLNKCKECTKKDVRKNRCDNIEYYRRYDLQRANAPERKKARLATTKAWRQADKRRMAAHNAVARAIKSGKIAREVCMRCGSWKSYAHHESYDRKLDVVWLCQPCHKQRHREMAIAGIEP